MELLISEVMYYDTDIFYLIKDVTKAVKRKAYDPSVVKGEGGLGKPCQLK